MIRAIPFYFFAATVLIFSITNHSNVLIVATSSSIDKTPKNKKISSPIQVGNSIHSSIIEENPEYYEDQTSDSDDDDSDSEYEEDDSHIRHLLSKALTKSTNTTTNSLHYIQKHRSSITMAIALFAFRREIWSIIKQLTTKPGQQQGRRQVRLPSLSPTTILKMLLFLDFLRKLRSNSPLHSQQQQFQEEDNQTLHPHGSLFNHRLLWWKDLLRPSYSAFIPPVDQHYTFEVVNDRFSKDVLAFQKVMNIESNPSRGNTSYQNDLSSLSKKRFDSYATRGIMETNFTSTSIILDMKGLDTTLLNKIDVIRDQISYILYQHRLNNHIKRKLNEQSIVTICNVTNNDNDISEELKPSNEQKNTNETNFSLISPNITSNSTISELEVIILLESPGGSAADYGLAAYQIDRLRKEPHIKVTICVDKVAASGGYMMACMSSPGQLYAAPFALLGSIGVIGQTFNIHNTLQSWGVKPLVFRGGKDKAPVGLIGEITKEGLAKVQDMVDKTHTAFKRHVATARPIIAANIESIATGDVWLGIDALKVGLIDRIVTSDEYISERIQDGAKVLKLIKFERPKFLFGSSLHKPIIPGGLQWSTFVSSLSDTIVDMKQILKKVSLLLDRVHGGEEGFVAKDFITTKVANGYNFESKCNI